MIKEFEISDILNAVNTISEIDVKEIKSVIKKVSTEENDDLTLNNQVKSDKRDLLVLNQMLE